MNKRRYSKNAILFWSIPSRHTIMFDPSDDDVTINIERENQRIHTAATSLRGQLTQLLCSLQNIPWSTMFVGLVLISCGILEHGFGIPKDKHAWTEARMNIHYQYCLPGITTWNAFLCMLFHVGGLWLHFFPNLIGCLLLGSIIEYILGSLNMLVVVILSYAASVLYALIKHQWVIQPCEPHGTGFSIVLNQWLTVGFASLFLHYWWRPYWKWRQETFRTKQFAPWYWWTIGIVLLFGGGWGILLLEMGVQPLISSISAEFEDKVSRSDATAHRWAVAMGHGVTFMVAGFMWYRHKCSEQETMAVEREINVETTVEEHEHKEVEDLIEK